MYHRKILSYVAIILISLIFASTAWAGNMQQSLLEKLPEPGEQLTRAEFVSMLVTAANIPVPAKTVYMPLDVSTGAWYAEDIKAALAAGIINHSSGDTIYPNEPITQAQAVALISRVLGLPGLEAPGPLPAPAPDHWAKIPYSWLIKEGILNTPISPEKVMTPIEGASLLNKVFGTSLEAEELYKKSQAAHTNIKTMRVTGNMIMSVEGNPNFSQAMPPETVQVRSNVTIEMNQEQGLSQKLIMNMSGLPEQTPPVEMEQYLLADGIHMKLKDPKTGAASGYPYLARRISKSYLNNNQAQCNYLRN
ncbi:hypothetical protein N752_02890 [Desulforamulus aquiferis]|nr:S-layer homology domain-containing protein [Desulforamulus aquiferis]RYD06633.1 hypothetical protein N752_02890 [Desulforamulus aquiferis]